MAKKGSLKIGQTDLVKHAVVVWLSSLTNKKGQLEINSKTPRQIGKTPSQILNPHAKHQDRGNHNSRREASKIQYQPASRNSSKL